MKPGDLIEWTYKSNGQPVIVGEELWSTPLKRWVPIGGEQVHLLISITDETIVWLNDKGLFHARVDDTNVATVIVKGGAGCSTRAWMTQTATATAP